MRRMSIIRLIRINFIIFFICNRIHIVGKMKEFKYLHNNYLIIQLLMINDDSKYQSKWIQILSFCTTVNTSNNLHSRWNFITALYFFNCFFNVKMEQPKKPTRRFPSKKLSVKKSLSSRVMNILGIRAKTKYNYLLQYYYQILLLISLKLC